MESRCQMQSLQSSPLPKNRFGQQGDLHILYAENLYPEESGERLLQTIRDLPHVSRLRLQHAIALQSGPANHLKW